MVKKQKVEKSKKQKGRRYLALMLSMTLTAGVFGACGKEGGESGQSSKVGAGNSAPEQERGRYVETEEKLPEELTDWNIVQMFAADEKLYFLTTKQEDGKTVLREWEKQGDSLTDVTQGWLASMELTCGDWLEVQLMQARDGAQYLYTGYVAEGEDSYKAHLWKGTGDTGEEITPEKWTVPNEWGGYEMIQNVAALDNGTLMAVSYSSMDILSGEDGSVLESEAVTGYYEGGAVTDGENVYLSSQDETGGCIEKRRDGKGSDVVTIPYPKDGQASEGQTGAGMSGSAKSFSLGALKDGTLIAAGEDGIFRLAGQADLSEAQWEKLVDGVDTDFSMGDYWCRDLVALEDGSIYALFQADGEMKLNRYEYDPDAVSQVTQVLKLYTVFESSLLKQAAAMYHKEHPDVRISIQYEYPMYYYEETDYNAVYQKLNTMLMGDEAPDILVMDHLNMDSYAAKGLLADLSAVVDPMEESGELLKNITGAYVGEDGKRYAVPLQFGFNMALGRDITPADMASIETLAGFLSQTKESYMGPQTTAELVDKFYPYFCDEIVSGKQLDKEALGRYLEYLKAIADNSGVIASRPENELEFGMWDLAAQAKLAFDKITGFTDCMFPLTMVDYIKGDFTAFENSFHPSLLTGICSRSQYRETAEDFLRFALSEAVQDPVCYNGFPVNRESLKRQAANDRSNFMMATMIMADDGSYIEFDSKDYPQETADRLVALCEGLDRPIKEDAKIRETLIECLEGYLQGTQSKEDTIQKIEAGLKMYLAE